MTPFHQRQNAIRSRLNRKMQVADQFGHRGIGINQVIGKLNRMAGGKANAVQTINRGDDMNQIGQAGRAAVMGGAAIGIDVLPQ